MCFGSQETGISRLRRKDSADLTHIYAKPPCSGSVSDVSELVDEHTEYRNAACDNQLHDTEGVQ